MQKELQITLTIIGILVIGGVLLHGMWTTRKNSEKLKKARFEPRNWDANIENENDRIATHSDFDEVGVGKSRSIINPEDADGLEPFSVNTKAQGLSDDLNAPLINDLADSSNPDNTAADDNFANFSNYATFVKDERGEANVAHSKQHASTPNSPDTGDSELPHVSKHDEPPTYSNVVTQRKPDFSKPVMTTDEESFGQPPESLLKMANPENSAPKTNDSAPEGDYSQKTPPQSKARQEPFYKSSGDKPRTSIEAAYGESKKSTTAAAPTVPEIEKKEANNTAIQSETLKQASAELPSVDVEQSSEKQYSLTEQAKRFVRRNKKTVAEKIRKEPVLQDKEEDEQMRIDFDESAHHQEQDGAAHHDELDLSKPETKSSPARETPKPAVGETDVLVLNVRASDENPISGASLLPMLLTLGFKFGEHDIFHRHVNTNGKGPILFSLTNMFKPGVFDIDNIENFSTYGLSLFMRLPIDADPQQVFNMMHNAARKLSEEFGCRILDVNKVGLSKQSLQQYVERIREFERRRISK